MSADRSQESLKTILSRALQRRGLATIAQAAQICLVANAVGQGRFRALRYRNQRLVVAVPSAVAAQELHFDRTLIITKIRQQLGWSDDQPLALSIIIRP